MNPFDLDLRKVRPNSHNSITSLQKSRIRSQSPGQKKKKILVHLPYEIVAKLSDIGDEM